MKKMYVAYGSNLNKIQMMLRCPTAIYMGPCEILDHTLIFRHYASIKRTKGENCPAALWLIDGKCEANLDRYEGVAANFYKKINVKVKYGEQIFRALTYKMCPKTYPRKKPFEVYYNICKKGYEHCGLDLDYLEARR